MISAKSSSTNGGSRQTTVAPRATEAIVTSEAIYAFAPLDPYGILLSLRGSGL
jgi:hypothetical protein